MPATSALPVLYSFRRCPYAIRARMALAVSGQRCELREVVLRDKPAALLAVSPQATVPVLVLPGQVLEHSLDIMRWALAAYDPHGWLNPGRGDLGAMLELIAQCDGPFKRALDRCKYPNRYPDASPADERAAAHAWLRVLEQRLALEPGGHLFGPRAALADMAIAPFVRQFAGIDDAQWQAAPWPHLRAWLVRWQQSPLFLGVMHKYEAWKPGAPPVVFPPITA